MTELKTAEELEAAKKAEGVNVILWTDQPAEAKKFSKLAQADFTNNYYALADDLAKDAQGTQATVYSSFAEPNTYRGSIGSSFRLWLLKNDREPVVKVDERTVNLIFKEHMTVVILFNGRNNPRLSQLLKESAAAHRDSDLVFAEISPDQENYAKVTDFFGIEPKQAKLIGVDGSMSQKAVYTQSLSTMSIDNLNNFVDRLIDQSIRLYDYK